MKRIAALYLSCFLAMSGQETHAQEDTYAASRLYLGAELNGYLLWGKSKTFDRVRQAKFGTKYSVPKRAFSYVSNFGVNLAYEINAHFTIATGVRLSKSSTTISADKTNIFSSKPFFWKAIEEGTLTEYVSLRSISQQNQYLGVPIEIKFFPDKTTHKIRPYVAVGTVLNLLLQSSNQIAFRYSGMEAYLPIIREQIGKASSLQGLTYVSAGLSMSDPKRTLLANWEILFPLNTFYGDPSRSLSKTLSGVGMELSVQIPIPFKNPSTPKPIKE